ncbi:pentatricopeptide repeat-containing protein At1g10910, chloroplastic isoform X2 [Solanum dulcamara]|uniref:pentatricopeptide repeat-containing protein At1g10910, chloroplastic isoform X2 n=1 Tax=Solanum dulcamara TaxID=45834 RepID=UPI0024852FE7|nr:pentatricopeptide repeat-containing protein At1g10910, chloroplastic isoform X2 [Solanum dulcamara]
MRKKWKKGKRFIKWILKLVEQNMGVCCVFQSIMALSSPSFFSSLPTPQAASNRNRRIHKFRSSTSVNCSKLGEFQNVLTDYVSSNHFPLSRTDRQSAILQIQDSSDLASALARHGDTLKVQDMNVILRYFGKLSRRWELYQLFKWMQQNQKINVASYSSYVKFMGKSLSCVDAVEMYRSINDRSIKFNVSVCNAFLSSLIKNGKSESSLKLFTQMKRDGLVPDVVTYSTLLSGCAKVNGGYYKAVELVQELMYNGLQMDSVTYGSLLSVCASHKECKEAAKYFQKMKDEGHSPNVYHYSSLLNAYSADRNYEMAEALIEEMRSAGLVLNKVIYTTLLKVYVKGGLFEKSKELLKELEALGYANDEMPFCLLMDGLAKSGHLLEAKSVFDEMIEKQVKADGYSYSIMISAFCRSGLLKDAKKLASEFEEKYDKYDIVILNAMLSAYCRAGEMENVMSMMKKMDDSAISPDWNTFNILIRYFCKEKLYLLAYRTMEDMHSKGHQPEEGLCSSLIYHLGKTGAHSEAFSVYNMLRYSKRTISKALHENILHILIAGRLLKDAYVVVKDNAGFISQPAIKKFSVNFMRSGNVNLINDVIKAMHISGHKIDQESFDLAISRYIAKPEKKELLLWLLKWMPGQGYAIDSSTRNLILKNSHLFGHQLIAESLSKNLVMSEKVKLHKENARQRKLDG